jgi:hypothetical protein
MSAPRRTVSAVLLFASISALLLLWAGDTGTAAEKRRPGASGTLAADDRALTADDLKALAFRSVGPANMGGRVSAIALVPGSRTSFYVGYGTGGLFRTDNLGVTFTPVFDDQPVLSIGSVAVADAPPEWPGWAEEEAREPAAAGPAAGATPDTKRREERGRGRVVWVGTGEGNGRNSSS